MIRPFGVFYLGGKLSIHVSLGQPIFCWPVGLCCRSICGSLFSFILKIPINCVSSSTYVHACCISSVPFYYQSRIYLILHRYQYYICDHFIFSHISFPGISSLLLKFSIYQFYLMSITYNYIKVGTSVILQNFSCVVFSAFDLSFLHMLHTFSENFWA